MLRIKTSGDDLEGYFVTITRENPRSEEHMPLAVLLQRMQAPPAAVPDVPPDAPPSPDDDLPAFLRPKGDAPPQRRVPISDPVGDAIQATNDVETRLMTVIAGLTQRLDAMDAAAAELMPAPPAPQPQAETSQDDVAKLTSYLDSLSEQIARATKMAGDALAATKRRAPDATDLRSTAIQRVREAAAEVRGRTIGVDADDRDTVRRLVEVAMNARAGNSLAVSHMEEIGDAAGRHWGDVAKEIIANHDRANMITVRTHIVEVRALSDIASAADEHVEGIATQAVGDLKKAGG